MQPPKRQLSHRLAKQKTQKLHGNINGELDIEDESLSETDSDVDPAWKPNTDENDSSKNYIAISGRRHVKNSKDQNPISENPRTTSALSNNNNDKLDETTAAVPFKVSIIFNINSIIMV